jgi:RNA polymerase sigma-70 factor (ECF subfamily)
MNLPSGATTSDEELLRLMLAGNADAFSALYRRQQGGVYRFALQMSGSPAVAEDVTQEVFLVLMAKGSRYDPARGSVRAFLYGIARNRVRRHRERGSVYVPLTEESDGNGARRAEPVGTGDDQLSELTRSEQIESVRHAVLSLPLRYREVVVLCELQELSYEDAAAVVSCSIGTIRSRLHRAREILGRKLQEGRRGRPVARETQPAQASRRGVRYELP